MSLNVWEGRGKHYIKGKFIEHYLLNIYIYDITGLFKYGNQYKELHEDMVISFPFYEITFDILL